MSRYGVVHESIKLEAKGLSKSVCINGCKTTWVAALAALMRITGTRGTDGGGTKLHSAGACARKLICNNRGRAHTKELWAIPVAAAFVLITNIVVWGNLRFDSFNPGAIAFFLTICAGCVVGSVASWRIGISKFGDLFGSAMLANTACSLLYGVVLTIEAISKGELGIGSLLIAFVAAPFLVLAASVPVAFVQSVAIYAMRKDDR